MKFFVKLVFVIYSLNALSVQASALLPDACIKKMDEKVGKTLVILEGRFDLNDEGATRAGIDRFEIKELSMVRHLSERRLKYRIFEAVGRFQMKDYP